MLFFQEKWYAPKGDEFFGGRIDLGNTAIKMLWEIKPVGMGSLVLGQAQVGYYSAWSGYTPGTSTPVFGSNPSLTLTGQLGVYTYAQTAPGVIQYQVDSPI